jgi:hypothetical protein
MAKFAKGKHALAISDRSGLAFPWREMVTEWNGAFVHYSEYERKQPQLEPKPFVADPQGLEKARPQVAPLPTPDLLGENPIVTNNLISIGSVYVVTQPNSGILVNDVVRLMSIKTNLASSTTALQKSIQELELSTTLASNITSTDTSMTVVDDLGFYTNGGYVVIEKINSTTGFFENEVLQYTAYDSSTKILSGLVRGTNAPFRGVSPVNTTASSHDAGAKIFGARLVDSLNETTQSQAGQPSTITIADSYNLKENDEGTLFLDVYGPGGGLNCLAGPVNNNFTSTNL